MSAWNEIGARPWEVTLRLAGRLVEWSATSGLRILLLLLVAWLARALVVRLSRRFHAVLAGGDVTSERVKRADTLEAVVRTIANVTILIAVGMMGLRELGLDVSPLIATAGIGGLAIGFGAQSLVKDVITGFFLLVEDQIRVGDVVEVGGKTGTVEAVTLRTVRLRDLTGTLHLIPNGLIGVVSNQTRGYSRYVVEIPLADGVEPAAAFEALRAVDEEMRRDPDLSRDILEPLEILGLASPGKAAVVRVRLTTRPRRQWHVGSEFNLRVKREFAARSLDLR